MKNIIANFFKKNYYLVILKKLLKRFEKNTSVEAKRWAVENKNQSIEDFFCSVDSKLYEQVKIEIKSIQEFAENKISKLNMSFGGGGNYILLYFLIRKFNLINIVETGVAAGWTSLAILKAIKKNGKGFLYSSDFPYFRLENPEKYIGYLAKNDNNENNWFLDIRGDDVALPEIVKRLDNNIDLFHYDSDKSYSGRVNALKILNSKINSNTIIIFDDIQNNLHFKDYVEKNKKKFRVFEFEGKFLGIVGLNENIT
ncbi:class I SAM-dependent methyltransferase [Candidatus Pelagibacter sp. HIMB1485]|uniref:class I SAM-dependent methyltransferase n=1 Tax=Candidatus Pelagibacter sp. HIMB1485 TaxID=3415415 RepID=UPI003F864855